MRKVNSVVVRPVIAKAFLREALTSRQLRIEIWSSEPGGKGKWLLERQVRNRHMPRGFVADRLAGVARQSTASRGPAVRQRGYGDLAYCHGRQAVREG